MTSTLTSIRQDLADVLAATPGVPELVTLDPATVHPPCLFVDAVRLVEPATVCPFAVYLSVWTLERAPGDHRTVTQALDTVPEILQAVFKLGELERAVELDAYSHTTGTLPGYRFDLVCYVEA